MAGIIILSVVFFYFNVAYPSGPLTITPPPVQKPNVTKVPLGYLFSPQYLEPKGMENLSYGTNSSSVGNFTLDKNGTTIITGLVTNKSSGNLITLTSLYVFAAPVYTQSFIGLNGTYKITVLIYGQMNLTFAVPGYKKQIISLNLQGGTYRMDLQFEPEKKLTWNGTTKSTTGAILSNVTVQAAGFLDGSSIFTSNLQGNFSISLYKDSYHLTALYTGYNSIPNPMEIDLSTSIHQNLTLTPKSSLYNLTGYVYSKVNDTPISNAKVINQQTNQKVFTNTQGYYVIGVISGMNRLFASHAGYYTNVSYFNASGIYYVNPVHNIYLEPLNPFLGNNTGYYGNSTQYPPLGNNSSTLNPKQSGTHLLTGRILVNGTSLPVTSTSLLFLVNINGSAYADYVITNSTGYYKTYFFYAGQYNILVESVLYKNKMLNVQITGAVTYDNFTLVPLNNKTLTVNGYVKNSRTLLPIANASVSAIYMKNNLVANTAYTNRTGYFSITIIEGNYTFIAASFGYKSNSTGVLDITANRTITIYLTPVQTLPVGSPPSLIAIGNSSSYGLPDLSPSQIAKSFNGTGSITSNSIYNITFHFNDSSGNSIVFTEFVIYLNVYGQVYYYIGMTNSSGFGYIPSINGGTYEILPEMFYYRGTVQNLTVVSNSTTWLSMRNLYTYGATMYLQNSFNLSNSLSANVPSGPLSITDSILPLPMGQLHLINSTKYTFVGYNGSFNFTYSNKHFVQKSFSLVISGAAGSILVSLTAFEIVVHGSTSTSWHYSIQGLVYNVAESGGVTTQYQMAYSGIFNISASLSAFPLTDYKTETLTNSRTVANVYFNQTTGIASLNLNNIALIGSDVQMQYSGSIPLNAVIFKGILPYSAPSNSTVYINNTYEAVNFVQGNNQTTFILNSYYLASVSINVEVNIPPNSNGGFNGGLGSLELYYYQSSLT